MIQKLDSNTINKITPIELMYEIEKMKNEIENYDTET